MDSKIITKKERQSNLELLRIIATFLIIMAHSCWCFTGGGERQPQ